jgi:hypothetical protein
VCSGDADGRGEVEHRIDAFERVLDRLRIAHVAVQEVDVAMQSHRACRLRPMRLLAQVVEHAHAVTEHQQMVGQGASR